MNVLIASLLLNTGLTIPVGDEQAWEVLAFRNLKKNHVVFEENRMRIVVDQSGGPIVHSLPKAVSVHNVKVCGSVHGKIDLEEGAIQGEAGHDDYILRIGLVEKGDRKLTWLQRKFSADWVKALYRLASDDQGIRQIVFLNMAERKEHLGSKRHHPVSDIFVEKVVWKCPKDGEFCVTHQLKEQIVALGVWISSDGDDTRSRFEVRLDSLEIY